MYDLAIYFDPKESKTYSREKGILIQIYNKIIPIKNYKHLNKLTL